MPEFNLTDPSPLSAWTLLVNLLIGLGLSLMLGWHYVKFGNTLNNRHSVARVLPVICLTTILIISVVKASLALSLGLVGALSIVRFRTPIKEPEELTYIFIAIAIALGLGADQRIPVLVASALIFAFIAIRNYRSRAMRNSNLYLNIELPANGDGGVRFKQLTHLVASNVKATDIRRVDLREDQLQATYHINCLNEEQLMALIQHLKTDSPAATVSFVDQNSL